MKWYKYDIRNLTNSEYNKWFSLMSDENKQKVDRSRILEDKKRTVVGEMLAKKAISEWCDIPPESIVFETREHGKPYAKDLKIEFNISHSGNMVVCAVDDKPIGIDIEQIRPIDLKLAKRFCTKQELTYLFDGANNKEILARFFKLWTAKEAYSKCLGKGLALINTPCSKETQTFVIENEYIVSIVKEQA